MLSALSHRASPHRSLWTTAGLACFLAGLILAGRLAWEPAGSGSLEAAEPSSEWESVEVPAGWKTPRGASGAPDGISWYRCLVEVPEGWKGQGLELFVEAVDDAREIYFNGVQVGVLGSFPPTYRSGLGKVVRLRIDAEHVRPGERNIVAFRVCRREGRGGFNVAAPVLFGNQEAIRLAGPWQARPGDDLTWGRVEAIANIDGFTFDRVEDAEEVNRTLRKLSDEEGPLPVAEAMKRITVADDLQLEVAVADPAIGQPLSMKFDEWGRLWVVEYLQYPDPAGLKMVSRDKYLRTVYDKVPPAPPNHFEGRDRISIHTDSDGDGSYDQHKTFVEGLSLVTSFARGRGGVWVLNPPYLLFYPDADQDDVPDGDPEVHLEGFGIEDSHSLANNLRWGPDGCLYGCQGSTVTGNIRRPGSEEKPVFSMGQLIWRYHPETRRYEIFAEGGGNTFGLEIDSQGRVYSGHNGGDTRGFHYVQGGYYRKGFGKHGSLSNPFTFGYFESMAHHNVPRFTHTFVIYEGAALPEKYHGKLFGIAPLQSHVVMSDVARHGSSFKTSDVGRPLESADPWFRPVDIQVGPDGAIYVADMYEQRIDHASHYQGRIDRDSGRIYRLRGKGDWKRPEVRLGDLSTPALVERLKHPNKWFRQTALRLLADRRDPASVPLLRSMLTEETGQAALEALWALNLTGGLNAELTERALDHENPQVRLWMVRLLCDDGRVDEAMARRLASLAEVELNVDVRCQLACSARRLPAEASLPIVRNLVLHSEDADDVFLPLLLWWALEDKAESNRKELLQWLADTSLWRQRMMREHLLERLMRRYAQSGSRQDLLACAALFELAPDEQSVKTLLAGFEQATSGRALTGMPKELTAALARVGGGSLALRLQQAEPDAVQEALRAIADPKGDRAQRLQYIQIFAAIGRPSAVPVLLDLVAESKDEELRAAALTTLGTYQEASIGPRLVQTLPALPESLREVAHHTLASRAPWSLDLLQAVDSGSLAKEAVPESVVRQIMLHAEPRIAELIKKHWGQVQNATTEEMLAEIQRVRQVLDQGSGNPYEGKKLFAEHCGKCHVLFGQGGYVGPDLTSYQRSDMARVLVNVVNPSIEIREGFENYVALTADGRVLTGFIADQDNNVVVLRDVEGQSHVIAREDLDDLRAIRRSIMPEGVLKPLDEQQLRDLFAYLRATQPLP